MEKYDYRKAVCNDIRKYLKNNNIVITPNNINEKDRELNEVLAFEDSVTGGASGSYTETPWQAAENLCHNWDILQDAADDWCEDLSEWIKRGEEYCDMHIRAYLLPQCLREVLDEVEIQIETLQELADYINESEELPENVMGIIEANEWEDLTGNDDEVCSDGYEKVVMENSRTIVRKIDKGNDYE